MFNVTGWLLFIAELCIMSTECSYGLKCVKLRVDIRSGMCVVWRLISAFCMTTIDGSSVACLSRQNRRKLLCCVDYNETWR